MPFGRFGALRALQGVPPRLFGSIFGRIWHGFGGPCGKGRRHSQRAFVNKNDIAVINLGDLQKLIDNKKIKADEKININTFKKSKLFRKSINKFKVLSNGNFKSKIDIEADYSSKTAKEKIEKAGGQITVKNQSK